MKRAAIDIGSNSVLLLVAEHREDGWQPVFESSDVTGLGVGTKETGLLGESGMEHTLVALKHFFAKARELGATDVRAAATMACRLASNTATFQEQAATQGTPFEVLSGEDEARYGFLAVAEDPTFAAYPVKSIVDVGGQSTEIVISEGSVQTFARSFPVGTLGLRGELERDGASPEGRLSGPEVLGTSRAVDDTFGFSSRPGQAGVAIALGATGTNLVTIRERMTSWEPERVHGQWLDYEEVGRAVGWLCGMTDTERASVPGIEKGRERSLHLGALILERGLFALKVEGCFVSIRGWRHAWLERF